jgi:drug/metabolite transporter (DMT)-like permease
MPRALEHPVTASPVARDRAEPTDPFTSAKVVAAFTGVYVLWGTTYLGIALALRSIAPFTLGAIRFLLAGSILYGWLRTQERNPLRQVNVLSALVCGGLTLAIGNGLVAWSQQGIPSGIVALIVTAVPIVVVTFDWAFFSRRSPPMWALLGMGMAFLGVVAIVAHMRSLSGVVKPLHLAAIVVAVVSFSLGTLLQARLRGGASVLSFTCVQLIAAGATLALVATAAGEFSASHFQRISSTSLLAVLYLAVFSGVLGLSCYLWLVAHVSAQKASTYALVNPAIAVILGSTFLGEQVTPLVVACAGLVLAGVALVLFSSSRPARR